MSIATGEITHIAGAFNEPGLVDGIGSAARFSSPAAIWGDATNLYVTEASVDAPIRRVNIATRQVTTLLGGFTASAGIWGDGSSLFLGGGRTIDKIDLTTLQVTRVAGDQGIFPFLDFNDGIGTAARFRNIRSMWSDGTSLYVGDECSIRKVALDTKQVTTLAGIPDARGHVDGQGAAARFNTISGIWGSGRLLFISSAHTIRTLDPVTGDVNTIAGNPLVQGTENGAGADARFIGPGLLTSDGMNLYVSDNGIREISIAAAAQPFNILASGADYWKTTSKAATMTVGYARVVASAGSTAADGVAIFSYRSNGVLVSEAAVQASGLIQEGRIYAENSGAVRTGIAIANPGGRDAVITFYFTDADGATFGAGTTTIAGNGQTSSFLDESPFGGGSTRARSFTFTSSVPVAAIALRGYINERSEFLMTTLPVAPIAPITPTARDPIVLPHFAAGGGWRTQVLLVNPTDEVIAGVVQLDSTSTYSIPPRSSVKVVSSGSGVDIQTGFVRIIPALNSRAPVASTVFSFVQSGITVTESGVPAAGTAQSFRVFAEFDSVRTGVAIANTGADPATVRFDLLDQGGQPTPFSGTMTLAASGHASLFINELPGFQSLPSSFRGVLRISGSAPISVIGLPAATTNEAIS